VEEDRHPQAIAAPTQECVGLVEDVIAGEESTVFSEHRLPERASTFVQTIADVEQRDPGGSVDEERREPQGAIGP
jgi:hypothetical protein